MHRLTWHGGKIPENEVWIKLGGDKGGGSFKMTFQICNVTHPNSPVNTCALSVCSEIKEKSVTAHKLVRTNNYVYNNYRTIKHSYRRQSCTSYCFVNELPIFPIWCTKILIFVPLLCIYTLNGILSHVYMYYRIARNFCGPKILRIAVKRPNISANYTFNC